MSNVIDALKRLERAGDENSTSTKKLVDAAITFAEAIKQKCPAHIGLPRRYEVVRLGTAYSGFHLYLVKLAASHQTSTNYVFGNPVNNTDGYRKFERANRTAALTLAKDIAEGWLNELADFLESRTAENSAAIKKIESAKG